MIFTITHIVTMSSIIFYDPDVHHHPSPCDPDILYLHSSQHLSQSILVDNHIQQIVCICCLDLSEMVNKVQEQRSNVLIYLCKKHGGHEVNPIYSSNVRDDIAFDIHGDWEVKVRIALVSSLDINQHQMQILDELQKIERIKQRVSDVLQMSVNVEGQQGNNPSNTSNDFDKSEETE